MAVKRQLIEHDYAIDTRQSFANGVEQWKVLLLDEDQAVLRVLDDMATVAAWHSKPSWFVVSDKDLILDPSAQQFFANRIKATTTIVEGGHDTLIAFPEQVAAAIEAASRVAKQ